MATTVSMPQLGETVTEGTILRWAKQVGDTVAEDEVLVEISTDKVDTEVPSPAAGTVLEILVPEGETVQVGTALIVIGDAAESAGSASDPTASAASEPVDEAAPVDEPAPVDEVAAVDEAAEVDDSHAVEPDPLREVPQVPDSPAPAPVSAEPEPQAPAASGETTTVSMPQLGETVTEGTILRWAKQVGDTVAEDEVLVEISTDKVDTEVPSPAAGTVLEILVPEGETVQVGTALIVIGAPGAAPAAADDEPGPAAVPAASESESGSVSQSVSESESGSAGAPPVAAPAAEATPPAAEAPSPGTVAAPDVKSEGAKLFLSPVVRKLVRENDLDPAAITGTGRDGRITRNDVLAHIDQMGSSTPAAPAAAPPAPAPAEPAPAPAAAAPAPPAAPAPTEQPAPPPPPPAPTPQAPAAAPAAAGEGSEERELDRLRAVIGANMIKAKQTAAHVWTSVEVDFSNVERVRLAHKASFKAEEGFSLTYLPFIARATMDALRTYPVVNSSFYLEERKAVFHHDINLGIAVDLNQNGLVVTSIRNADSLRIRGIARSVRDLAAKARDNKLEPNDISGSTFTITNPGPFGSFMSAPIINVPNVAILSTDTVAKRPTVVTTADGQDTIAIRPIGYLGLSWDHRAFDGSTAVLFLQRIKQNLESWDWGQELT